MIHAYKNAKTKKVHETGNPKGFKGLDGGRALRVLNILKNANSIDDLPILSAYWLHKLPKDRRGPFSMSANLPWVVCFTPARGGGWQDVAITDEH